MRYPKEITYKRYTNDLAHLKFSIITCLPQLTKLMIISNNYNTMYFSSTIYLQFIHFEMGENKSSKQFLIYCSYFLIMFSFGFQIWLPIKHPTISQSRKTTFTESHLNDNQVDKFYRLENDKIHWCLESVQNE